MDEPTIALPQVFGGRYERGPMIARGGMAAVYRARDRRLQRDVALKVTLQPGSLDEASRARASREARALAALDDPRVVRVLDADEEAGLPYLVMELIEGVSLAERLRSGPLAPAEAARVGAEVAGALAAVHARGLVHRDVKPDNVLLVEGGDVRLVDFGIARADAGAPPGTTATLTGVVVGTPGYIAPEVLVGGRPDARADVYALGVAAAAPARPRVRRGVWALAAGAAVALGVALGIASAGDDPGQGPVIAATTVSSTAPAVTAPSTVDVAASSPRAELRPPKADRGGQEKRKHGKGHDRDNDEP